MKYNINNISGEVVKDNDTYLLKDNLALNNLVLSSTTLHPKKKPMGIPTKGKKKFIISLKGGEQWY